MKRYFSLIIVGLLFMASCAPQTKAPVVIKTVVSCAEKRLDTSYDFHQKAKDFLASYYKTRKESELFFAWYASEDSVYMAQTIKKCFDKKNKHYFAVKNIYQKNDILQNLIVQNMRLDTQSQLSELFLEDYRKIFVRDIQ